MMNDVEARFTTMLVELFGPEARTFSRDRTLQDLELDSLGLLDFVLSIEREFGIEVDMNHVNEEMTLAEILRVVKELASGDDA